MYDVPVVVIASNRPHYLYRYCFIINKLNSDSLLDCLRAVFCGLQNAVELKLIKLILKYSKIH